MKKLFGLLFAFAACLAVLISFDRGVMVEVAATPHTNAPSPPVIVSISVCRPDNPGNLQPGSCTSGFDTHQLVLGPGGQSVNSSLATLGGGIGVVPDEHSTVYAPDTLNNNADYVFFLSTGIGGNAHIGVSVLSGGDGPDHNGQWTLKLPKADGYGSYASSFGPVFNPSTIGSICPAAPRGDATRQDQTFDMHYASAGSILKDPTAAPGSMLMVY
jgi:hypothetical protein